MAANFLHGVETIEIDRGPRPVKLVKTAVIGLIGTAAAGAKNTPILVTREADFAQFGADGPGFTIRKALEQIFKQKGTVCIVINVYDPATHTTPTRVQPADIIGTINSAGQRTGLKAFRDAYQLFGYYPKILLAPVFGTLSAVSAELIATAESIRAFAFVSAPVGTTFQQAIAARGSSGAINFNTSSRRVGLCFPHVKDYDVATSAEVLAELSTYAAGALARKDQENGYWWSPSNTELLGVTGMEMPVYAMINDPASEANLLNEAGIITVFNSYGTGIRLWGNRSAAFPAETHPKSFINVLRTADVIAESLEYYALQYVDRPMDNALIDAIVESGNAFMRKLKADGALIDGRVWYESADNEATELAAGHVTFTYDFMPPTPTERVTYKSIVNLDYLKQLGAKSS